MNPPSEDVAAMLIADSGLGIAAIGTDLFLGREPTDPDDVVTIFDTPGRPPMLTMTKGENYYYPSIQMRIRNNDYRTGMNLANDIKESLHGRGPETWNGTVYTLIRCNTEPSLLDWDDNRRARLIINFNLQRR